MTVTFNSEAYLQERILIKVSGIANNARIGFDDQTQSGAILTETVYYTPNKNHKLTIDVTDLVRADCQIGELFEFGIFEDISGGDVYQNGIDIVGYTNPKNWLVPLHAAAANWELVKRRPLPNKIVQNITGIPNVLPATKLATTPAVYRVALVGDLTEVATDNNIVLNNIAMISIQRRAALIWNTLYSLILAEQECDKRYVAVQWLGRDGNIKRATWELRRATENTAGEVEIENITNAYDVRKGSEITAVLHLGGLTAYDVWYYGDIVTSSDVRLALDASDYDAQSDTIVPEQKIAVTTKKIEIPDGDGGKFYDLDIEINYKRYDTV